MANEKIYCGNGKRIGEKKIAVSINLSKIPTEWVKKDKNGNEWLNLVMWQRNDDGSPDQYGNHFSVQVDTFKPQQQ